MNSSERTSIYIYIAGILCLAFFVAFILFVFSGTSALHQQLEPLFRVVNPFTAGVYCVGMGMLLTLACAKGRSGAVLGLALCVSYLVMAAIALVALLRMGSVTALMMYGPNVVIVYAGIMIMVRRGRKN